MSKAQSTSVRLAAAGTHGSNLYNAYQVLAQVGALYVKAQSGERNSQITNAWTQLSDSALTDLGVLVNVWQAQSREKSPAFAMLDTPDVAARIERLCRRIEVIETRCTIWTTSVTYVRILLLCEKHIQRIFKKFTEMSPEVTSHFSGVVESGHRRMDRLRQTFALITGAMKKMDDSYVPQQKLSGAS